MPDPVAPKITLVEHERYLEALIGATSSPQEIRRQLEELLTLMSGRKPERLLVDFRAISPSAWTTLDRYGMGVLGGQLAAYVGRVACLATSKFVDPQKFGVQVAQNRGLKVDIFTEDVEALRWLLEA
jgi:hypothetical protein